MATIADLPEQLGARLRLLPSGCWEWTGARTKRTNGYGQVRWRGRRRVVHQVVYELLVGPIPDGKTLDHVRTRGCVTRLCACPEHLEPVTMQENILRGDGMAARRARQTMCLRGHLLSGTNLRITNAGSRRCLACKRENERHRRAHARVSVG